MKNKDKLKLLLIGVGSWGFNWIQVILKSKEWEIAAIVDTDEQMLEKARQSYGIKKEKTYITIDAALNNVKADAALIVVPPKIHLDVTVKALKSCLHCLVEKPLAPTIKEAKIMIDEANKNNKELMVSQNYRYGRTSRTIKNIIRRGIIGEVGTVFVDFHAAPHFGGFRDQMEEPLIIEMAVHHFDQMRSMLGLEPKNVFARSWNPGWSWFKGNAVAAAIFEMNNGAVISYNGNWVTQGHETSWNGDWCIQGDGGEISWKGNEVSIRSSDFSKALFAEGLIEKYKEIKVELIESDFEDRFDCLHEFAAAINEEREPETSGRDNLNTMAMVIGARKSAELNKIVVMEDLLKEK